MLKNNNSSIKQQAKPPKVSNNLSEGITLLEQLAELREELKQHKDAIRYLLHNDKKFQNEIQKEKFKKES